MSECYCSDIRKDGGHEETCQNRLTDYAGSFQLEKDVEIAALKSELEKGRGQIASTLSLLSDCEAALRTISQEPCTQEKACCLCCLHCISDETLAKISAWRKSNGG